MKQILTFFLLATIASPAQTNVWKRVKIESIQAGVGAHSSCVINGQSVLMQGLPAETIAAYQRFAKLDAEVKKLSAEVEKLDQEVSAAQARGPSSAPAGTPAGEYIRHWNIQANNLRQKQKELDRKEAELERVRESYEKVAEIQAVETTQTYNGKRIWVVKR